jgi:hypothetical protein
MEALLKQLSYEKIKINWNKNPIKMDLLLSFLTVKVERSRDHLGSTNGWTKLFNEEHKLIIGGGIVGSNEYIDHLEYGVKLHNRFNNWVNPFFLFPIMTQEGKDFFLDYYKKDIAEVIQKQKNAVAYAKERLKAEKEELAELQAALAELKTT